MAPVRLGKIPKEKWGDNVNSILLWDQRRGQQRIFRTLDERQKATVRAAMMEQGLAYLAWTDPSRAYAVNPARPEIRVEHWIRKIGAGVNSSRRRHSKLHGVLCKAWSSFGRATVYLRHNNAADLCAYIDTLVADRAKPFRTLLATKKMPMVGKVLGLIKQLQQEPNQPGTKYVLAQLTAGTFPVEKKHRTIDEDGDSEVTYKGSLDFSAIAVMKRIMDGDPLRFDDRGKALYLGHTLEDWHRAWAALSFYLSRRRSTATSLFTKTRAPLDYVFFEDAAAVSGGEGGERAASDHDVDSGESEDSEFGGDDDESDEESDDDSGPEDPVSDEYDLGGDTDDEVTVVEVDSSFVISDDEEEAVGTEASIEADEEEAVGTESSVKVDEEEATGAEASLEADEEEEMGDFNGGDTVPGTPSARKSSTKPAPISTGGPSTKLAKRFKKLGMRSKRYRSVVGNDGVSDSPPPLRPQRKRTRAGVWNNESDTEELEPRSAKRSRLNSAKRRHRHPILSDDDYDDDDYDDDDYDDDDYDDGAVNERHQHAPAPPSPPQLRIRPEPEIKPGPSASLRATTTSPAAATLTPGALPPRSRQPRLDRSTFWRLLWTLNHGHSGGSAQAAPPPPACLAGLRRVLRSGPRDQTADEDNDADAAAAAAGLLPLAADVATELRAGLDALQLCAVTVRAFTADLRELDRELAAAPRRDELKGQRRPYENARWGGNDAVLEALRDVATHLPDALAAIGDVEGGGMRGGGVDAARALIADPEGYYRPGADATTPAAAAVARLVGGHGGALARADEIVESAGAAAAWLLLAVWADVPRARADVDAALREALAKANRLVQDLGALLPAVDRLAAVGREA